MPLSPPYATRGFTLLEVVIVLALIGLLLALGAWNLNHSVEQINVDIGSHNVIATLQLARSRTVASQDDTQYGIHFNTTQYVLFQGSSYTAGDSNNEVYTLANGLEFFNVSLGGGNDVIFQRVEGNTTNAGTIGLRPIAQPANSRLIQILPTGGVGLQSSVTLSNTRLTDTRHLHFDLNWSIQTANNLTLTFPGFQQTIAMASYFNSDKSVFDWEDTVTVNGNEEIFRIHTHALDASHTVLSIHRDRRYDDLSVVVAIDNKQIATYAANGTATVGPFGGTMQPQ